MIFEESITGVQGFAGTIPIGVAKPTEGRWGWSVEIFNKASLIKVPSRRAARELMAVHGADRVDVSYRLKLILPKGFSPAWLDYLPSGGEANFSPGLTLDEHLRRLAAARTKKISNPESAFDRRWLPAFE